MYAVIKTGGKQYRVAPEDKIQIEKLAGQAGDRVEFSDVLMVSNDGAVEVGYPYLSGVKVVGEIASQDRGPRVIIFKKRRRKHYRRKNGHRQDLTSVLIRDILTGADAETAPVATEAAAAAEAKPAKKAAKPKATKAKTEEEKE
jgi:large subunit ribosomal protein L21